MTPEEATAGPALASQPADVERWAEARKSGRTAASRGEGASAVAVIRRSASESVPHGSGDDPGIEPALLDRAYHAAASTD